MKVGLIVPSSMLFPTVGLQFSEGALLAKKLWGTDIDEIIIEGAETCTDSTQVQKAANILLLQKRVDVIVGYVGHVVFNTLIEICEEYKKILILADMGGALGYELKSSPYVFMHSLNEWAVSYALGKRLSHHEYRMSTLSMMEAGYSISYAFVRGLQDNGADINVGYHISKLNFEPEFFERFKNAVEDEKPDLINCAFTGKDADAFFDDAGAILETSNTQISGSGWLTLPNTLSKHGKALNGAKTASAYYTTIDNDANKTFTEEFEKSTENTADRFALLGYEIVMMLLKAAVYNEDGKFMSKKTAQELEQIEIDSPRGKVSYDENKHYAIGGAWYAEVRLGKDNVYYNHIVDHEDKIDMEEWRTNSENWPNGGWFNPYPCT